jgi:hypothetical protein
MEIPWPPKRSSTDGTSFYLRQGNLAHSQDHSGNTMNPYATDAEIPDEERSPVTKRANGQPMRFSAFFATKDDKLPDDDENIPVARREDQYGKKKVWGGPSVPNSAEAKGSAV